MTHELRFDPGLYRGAAGYYDRFRLPYPAAMLEDLAGRAGVSGRGRLLDLACGTGQLALPLRGWFSQVWAVDREPDMVAVLADKAAAAGARGFRAVVSDAETLDLPSGHFELAVIGNAFHRLDRDLVARRVLDWLAPGGALALCWSSGPWDGDLDWQRALAATVDRWRTALRARDRVPEGWELPRQRRPDRQVLADAGFEAREVHEFAVEHRWSLAEVAGWIRSTSALPATVLGDQGAAFDADLADSLAPYADGGSRFPVTVSFAYDLGRKAA